MCESDGAPCLGLTPITFVTLGSFPAAHLFTCLTFLISILWVGRTWVPSQDNLLVLCPPSGLRLDNKHLYLNHLVPIHL